MTKTNSNLPAFMQTPETYTADDVVWSIYRDTHLPYDKWKDEDRVGFDTIEALADGDYRVGLKKLWMRKDPKAPNGYASGWHPITTATKVKVRDGRIDIQSCKQAVAEFLNATGDFHVFIESVDLVDASDNVPTVTFFLGS